MYLQILGISSNEVSPLSDRSASESCSSNVLDRRGILLLLSLLLLPPVHSEPGKHERDNVIIVLLFPFNICISLPPRMEIMCVRENEGVRGKVRERKRGKVREGKRERERWGYFMAGMFIFCDRRWEESQRESLSRFLSFTFSFSSLSSLLLLLQNTMSSLQGLV